MEVTILKHRLIFLTLFSVILLGLSCAVENRITSNSLDFLYPKGVDTSPPSDVTLQLPLRVGIAFAPTAARWEETLAASQKQTLLESVATAFRDHEGLGTVEVIPAAFLKTAGGFENLDQLIPAFGLDIIALVSYDQFQFSDTTRKSWTYWTLVGAYLVKGEENETHTMMDAVIVEIPSRAILFTSSGQSQVSGKTTPINVSKELRAASVAGFEQATSSLIENLDAALDAFEQQALTGTIRGEGTPAVEMYSASGERLGSGGGGGAAGWLLLGALGFLLALAGRDRH
jgi:rhombotail lipoprotein